MLDVATLACARFAASEKSESAPRWSPDGKRLAFLSDRGGKGNRIHVVGVEGGKATALETGKEAVNAFEWSPDGNRMAFVANEPLSDEEKKRRAETGDVRVVDRDDRSATLWILDLRSKKFRKIAGSPWKFNEIRWLADNRRLAVIANDRPHEDAVTERICLVEIESGTLSDVRGAHGPVGGLSVSPDGRWLAWIGPRGDGPDPHDLWLAPLDGGDARKVTGATLDRPVNGLTWNADGTMLVSFEEGFGRRLVRL